MMATSVHLGNLSWSRDRFRDFLKESPWWFRLFWFRTYQKELKESVCAFEVAIREASMHYENVDKNPELCNLLNECDDIIRPYLK